MTDKELKSLSRKQLLELLLFQTRQMERLEKKITVLEEKLNDKRIIEKKAGNIAEASLNLHGIFEAAQAAADQYVENVKRMADEENNKEEDDR